MGPVLTLKEDIFPFTDRGGTDMVDVWRDLSTLEIWKRGRTRAIEDDSSEGGR